MITSKINKFLIVGGFPPKTRKIFGGIVKSSSILVESKYFSKFEISKFDSSQISNPPPSFLIRLILAIIRLIKFIFRIIYFKPKSVLIFCSDGGSSIEKGIMILICDLFKIKSLIFPRAGNLIIQTQKNKIMLLIIKLLFGKASVFLCQGEKWKEFAIHKLKINKKNISIINNWTATDELIEIGENRIMKDKTEGLKILFVGWLEKEKGIIELLDVFRNLHDQKYNIHLSLIGDGSLKIYSEKFIKKNKLSDFISIKGWLNTNDINNYLKESDIFVLPSWQEGMPNALIEAISSGLPSVVSSVGVIPDYFTNNENVLLTEPKNTNNLKNSIEKLINDIKLRKKLSENGIMIAKKFFSSEVSLKKLSKRIEELVY